MKRILMGFGAVTMLGMLAMFITLGVVGSQAVMSADDNKQAAVAAIRKISQDWSVSGRDEIVAPSLIRISQTPKGNRAFQIFSRLGALQKAGQISQTHFGISSETGTTATVTFEGTFTNGLATVIVKLRKVGDAMKVVGLQTKASRLLKRVPQTAA